jgi:phosphonate dehydrogenase
VPTTPKLPKIVLTHPVHEAVHSRLQAHGQVLMNPQTQPWPRAQLQQHLADADAMMGFMTDHVDAALLRAAPRLAIVACALKGFDNYDVAACTEAGVWVSIVPDLLTEPTAELAIGLAIGLARHVRAGDALVREGSFQGWRPQLYGSGLAGAEVAVLGLGAVGQAIIARLQGFGCARIHGIDPQPRLPALQQLPLQDALARADHVFVAAPLTPTSLHLLNPQTLAHSKPGQFIVNVGRGAVVDEEAIADALDSGRLAGYAADVFGCEDWALPDRPASVPERLRNSSRTLLTPHLGSAVASVRLAIEHRAADNIVAVLLGQAPPDAINRPRGREIQLGE